MSKISVLTHFWYLKEVKSNSLYPQFATSVKGGTFVINSILDNFGGAIRARALWPAGTIVFLILK
jgi:hypothetical protein